VTVNLVGVGGTGSQVLTALARIDHALYKLGHPGLHVRAYDPDIVTGSNIGRQLFSQSDTGLNKADVLTTRLNRFFSLSWEAIPEEYNGDQANITISCVDNVNTRVMLYKVFKKEVCPTPYNQDNPLYWLDFGNSRNTGQVVLGTVQTIKQPKIEGMETVPELKTVGDMVDLSSLNDEDSGPSCSLAEALTKQDLFINSTLAQLGCALFWKLLSSGSVNYHGVFLNLETMNVNPIKL
jgi:PRTRC genetic system ThiF family protein